MPAVLTIFDDIGHWAIDAKSFIAQLDSLDLSNGLTLRINSQGGSVFDALAMMNAINSTGAEVTVEVIGLAASAAGFLAVGTADRLLMHEDSFLMVHLAQSGTIGNRKDMAAQAAVLLQIDNMITDIFARRTGGSRADWMAALEAETWFDATEMADMGLAEVIPAKSGMTTATAMARSKVANRSIRTQAFIDRLTAKSGKLPESVELDDRAELAGYARRVAQLEQHQLEESRALNRERIIANGARSGSNVATYLQWS